MASVKFDTYLDHLLDGFVWTTATVEAALFDKDTWVPDPTDGFVLTATTAGAIEVAAASYARVSLVSPTKNLDGIGHRGLLSSAIIDFGILEAGFDFDTLLLYTFVTNDTDSWLLAAFDVGAQTTGGVTAERFVPDVDGLFSLTAP